jgi:hypothetical protein
MRILHSFFKDLYGDDGNVRFLGFFVYKHNLPFLCLGIIFRPGRILGMVNGKHYTVNMNNYEYKYKYKYL